jgi:hypothetical protein
MISLLDINKAINEKIELALAGSDFNTVPIIASDLSEPNVRPFIKVVLDNGSSRKMNSCMKEQTLQCRVYFFASDLKKYKIENMKVRDLIQNEFLTPLVVSDTFIVDIDEIEANTSDTVLICSFDIETLEDIPETIINDGIEYEPMENLYLDLKE